MTECWEENLNYIDEFRKRVGHTKDSLGALGEILDAIVEYGKAAGMMGPIQAADKMEYGKASDMMEYVKASGMMGRAGASELPKAQVHADFTLRIDEFLNAEGAKHIDRIVEGVQWMFDRHVRGGDLVCVLFGLVKLGFVVDAHYRYMPGFVMLVNYALAERKAKMMMTPHNRTLFDPLYDCFRFHPFHQFTSLSMVKEELEKDRLLPRKKVEKALKRFDSDVKNMNDFLNHITGAA